MQVLLFVYGKIVLKFTRNEIRKMKTVQELIDELSDLPRNAFVVLAQDAEGNSYKKIDCVEEGYLSEDPGYGELDLIFHDEVDIYDEEKNEGLTDTVVIWPL